MAYWAYAIPLLLLSIHYFFLEDFLVLVFFEEILNVLAVLVVVALLAGL